MAEDTKKPASAKKEPASTAKKPAAKAASENTKTAEDIHARVEAEKKALDEIITSHSSAAEKKKAIDEIRIQLADDIIKNKPPHQDNRSAEEIKKKAAEAKKAKATILGQTFVSDPDDHLKRLADTFDTSARRWEMVVYPTLFAFILLAGYGFYLIYHLTHDISILSQSVTRMATIVSNSMPKMTEDIRGMTGSVDNMSGEVGLMSNQMTTLTPMSQNIANMTGTMHDMNRSVYGMQRDMSGMNRTVSGGPFGMMSDVMPFTSNSYTDPLPPRPMTPPRIAQPMPRYAPPPAWARQPTRRAPNRAPVKKAEKPAAKKLPVVNDEIVKKDSSNTVVKKN